MNYELKYIKYKKKYLKLKKNLIGGKLDSNNIAIKYTKEDYDKLSEQEQNKFPFYCKNDKPFLCTFESPSYGLCKQKITDCFKYTGENTYLEYDLSDESRKKEIEFGRKFNYDLYAQQDKNCSKLIVNSEKVYEGTFILPKKFKIITYNCWWSMKITSDPIKNEFHHRFLEIRIKNIAEIINESGADIVCLQEVGKLTFDILQKLLNNIYPYYYENPFNCDDDNEGLKGRTIETVCFCKYPVKKYKLFSVSGNLNYNNSMLMIEYDNLIIFNVYLQAGTRNSPGQKDLWYNYSRCRYNEYLTIGKYIKENNINKPIIVLGDFNTNLNGNFKEWPELKAFKKLKLQDSWLEKYDNKKGFTEDTSINLMRWNIKFEEKIYRIDGIFYSENKFKTNEIKILGNEPININKDMQDKFYDIKIPDKQDKDKLIRKNDKLQLWPSDHFAVIADLELL